MRSDVRPCNFYLVPVQGRLAAVKRGAVMTLVEYFEAKGGAASSHAEQLTVAPRGLLEGCGWGGRSKDRVGDPALILKR